MDSVFYEGIFRNDNGPIPVQCLIQPSQHEGIWWRPHYHEYIELLYPLEGEYEIRVGGDIVLLSTQSLLVIRSGEPHCTRGTGTRQTLLCIKVLPEVLYGTGLADSAEMAISLVEERFSRRRMFDRETLSGTCVPDALTAAYRECQENRFGSELILRAEIQRVFLWVARFWYEAAGAPPLTLPRPGATAALRQVRDYVREHYATANLRDAAALCGLSYGYLSRLFGKWMNMSFSAYVNHVRVNRSLRLLVSTDMSITQIASELGFSSTSHFILAFRKDHGLSPDKYRRTFHA